MSSLNFLLARRFLLSQRTDRFFSVSTIVAVLGIAFGVAALVISLAVIAGFQKSYREAILKFNSHLVITKADEMEGIEELGLPDQFLKEAEGISPFIYREGMMLTEGGVKGIVIKGVDLEKFSHLSHLTFKLTGGPEPFLLLGSRLAAAKEVKILFPRRGVEPHHGEAVRRFRVGGTFESGLYEYDSSFALLPLKQAQQFFQMGHRISGLEVWLKDPDKADAWAQTLREHLSFPYVVLSWRDLNENLFRALETEKVVFFFLMVLLSSVASLNLLATLIMLLIKKQGTIGILRVVGFTWGRIRKIFLLDGLLIGFAGLTGGLVLSGSFLMILGRWRPIRLAAEVYFIDRVPVFLTWETLFLVAAVALGLVTIGSLLTLRGIHRIPVLRSLTEK